MRRAVAALVAILLLTSVVTAATTYTLGADHGLNDDAAIENYESEGVAVVNTTAPDLTLRMAEEASACGVEGSITRDVRNDYLCVGYDSDLKMTLKFELSGEYFHPYVRESKSSIADEAPATFALADGGNNTAVTIEFDGAANAVYPIPEDATAAYYVVDRSNSRLKQLTGLSLFGDGNTSWHPIDSEVLRNKTQVRINSPPSETVVQYDATPNATDSTWLTVPEGPAASASVYRTSKGSDDTVYVVSEESGTAPPVRYKRVDSASGRLDAAMEEVASIDDRISVMIDSIFGDDGEDSDD